MRRVVVLGGRGFFGAAAVDRFRADKNLNYQGNAAGLVDARLVDALRAAYIAKKKTGGGR